MEIFPSVHHYSFLCEIWMAAQGRPKNEQSGGMSPVFGIGTGAFGIDDIWFMASWLVHLD